MLFIGLVVVGILLFQSLAGQRLEADVRAADLALARAIAQETDILMDNALEAVRQLGREAAVMEADEAGMTTHFRTFMSARGDVNLVYRLGADGAMLFHYPIGPSSTVGVDFSFRDYFQEALHSQEPLVSKGRISPTTEQPVATAVMPLRSEDGTFVGVVGSNLKLQFLSQTLSQIVAEYPREEQLQILIVDAAGQIIAHSNPAFVLHDAGSLLPVASAAALDADAGSLLTEDGEGQAALYSHVPIDSVGWDVVISHPTAAAFATPSLFQRAALLSILVILLAGLFFWMGLSRYFIRPLVRLTAFSQSIGQERPFSEAEQQALKKVARRADQIGHLTRSMQRMHTSVEARLDELGTLLATSAAVVSTLDLQVVLDRILEQVENLLDVHMCALFVLDEQDQAFRVKASRGLAEWYTNHLVVEPGEHDSVTLRALHSGEPVQISDTETNPSFKKRRDRAQLAGYRSLLAVPLKMQHAPPAALLVFRSDVHTFGPREIGLLRSFANHAAMAIENATLYARSDMRLQEQTRRLEALVESMMDGLILEDLEGRVLYANRRIETFTGLTMEAIQGQNVAVLMEALLARAHEREAAEAALARAAESGDDKRDRRAEFALEMDAALRHVRLKMFDVVTAQGNAIGRGRILQDITQRHEIDRMKASLISTVSHELRTPLAAIKGYASTLLADDVEWDARSEREFLQIISDESDELAELVNNLLDMSRIEAGNLAISRQPCSLAELVSQAAQRALPAGSQRLQVEIEPSLPLVHADPQHLTVVLRNLLENAARYSDNHLPIRLRASQEGPCIIVRVEDEGPGIAPEHQLHIFDSFYRVEDGLTRRKTGAGLGLAIARGFVRAHGGDIWLEPRNRGTCMAFSLPLELP